MIRSHIKKAEGCLVPSDFLLAVMAIAIPQDRLNTAKFTLNLCRVLIWFL